MGRLRIIEARMHIAEANVFPRVIGHKIGTGIKISAGRYRKLLFTGSAFVTGLIPAIQVCLDLPVQPRDMNRFADAEALNEKIGDGFILVSERDASLLAPRSGEVRVDGQIKMRLVCEEAHRVREVAEIDWRGNGYDFGISTVCIGQMKRTQAIGVGTPPIRVNARNVVALSRTV